MADADSARPSKPRTIKRYSNRKLYDTGASRYVTLREIEALIRSGEDVRIIDYSTHEDLTNVTLAQILLEQEKSGGGRLLPSAIRELIHGSGERFIASIRESPMVRLIRRNEASTEGEADDSPPSPSGAAKRVADAIEHGRGALDELQKRIDERVRTVLQNLAPWVQLEAEVRRLSERVEALERALRGGQGRGNTE